MEQPELVMKFPTVLGALLSVSLQIFGFSISFE